MSQDTHRCAACADFETSLDGALGSNLKALLDEYELPTVFRLRLREQLQFLGLWATRRERAAAAATCEAYAKDWGGTDYSVGALACATLIKERG